MAKPKPPSAAVRESKPHPVLLALTILLTPALWILFVATINPHELLVGAFASVLTIAFTLFVCRFSPTRPQFRARDLIQAWRIPGYILSDAFTITFVLAKDLLHLAPAGSHFRVCGFDASAHDPVREARSILAIAYATATPNSIVLGIDPAQSRMLFHQLKATPVPKMIQFLGGKPGAKS